MRAWLKHVSAGAAMLAAASAMAAGTPDWVNAQVAAPVPAHDDETEAVMLLSDVAVTVAPDATVRRRERAVYRILRPDGSSRGTVRADFNASRRITSMRGWSIPASGRHYEVGNREAVESAVIGVDGGELISDARSRLLRIPAANPGSIVGYEIESEEKSLELIEYWDPQETIPVREAHYSLLLPAGWSHKARWVNRPDLAATSASGALQWSLSDLKAVPVEPAMPNWAGVAARMTVTLLPPAGAGRPAFETWQQIGAWYGDLTRGRRDASPAIRAKVADLTTGLPDKVAQIRALAAFVQQDIRYVAIELGIGGLQPHAAPDVFALRYGDCKDKATLLGAMLREIGVDSYYVIINTQRGAVTAATPPTLRFNHAIIAIQAPAGLDATAFPAVIAHPTLGKLLFFDPTATYTPIGRLPGALQANFGMLVSPAGGEIVQLPKLPPDLNGLRRTARLMLDEQGLLRGEVDETLTGEVASSRRYALRATTQSADQMKLVERMLAGSLASFKVLKSSVDGLFIADQPMQMHYALEASNYAKSAGDLLLVRPRVLGGMSSGLLETRKPRQHSIEFDSARRDTDSFEITVPQGYVVEELPPPVTLDYGFAAYQSSTVFEHGTLRFTRAFEIRDVSVPVARADELKRLYREIHADEGNSAVLKRAGT